MLIETIVVSSTIAACFYCFYRAVHTPAKMPCPHKGVCKYELPTPGLTDATGRFIPEQCPVCQNWVKWNNGKDRYMRVEAPRLEEGRK